jgi:hypothetical protein
MLYRRRKAAAPLPPHTRARDGKHCSNRRGGKHQHARTQPFTIKESVFAVRIVTCNVYVI